MRRLLFILLVLPLMLLVTPAGAVTSHGEVAVIFFKYAPDPVIISQGGELFFTNLDYDGLIGLHSVTSISTGPFGALFDSGEIGFAQRVSVSGVSDLPTGKYTFYCTFHTAAVMSGTLIVT